MGKVIGMLLITLRGSDLLKKKTEIEIERERERVMNSVLLGISSQKYPFPPFIQSISSIH